MIIAAKIKFDEIELQHLFQGAKHQYLDLVLIESKEKRYGDDYMVVQGVSQTQREQGVRGRILGNAKILQGGGGGPPAGSGPAQPAQPAQPPQEDELDAPPF